MSDEDRKFTVRIESILGGLGLSSNFQAQGQYRLSLGIDPSLPIDDGSSGYAGNTSSGLLRPVSVYQVASTLVTVPMWIDANPKDENFYIAGANGSTFAYDGDNLTLTGLSDGGNESGTSSGNGMAYYDNYIYFARNTTIARYGPLNGTPTMDGDYWGTTLGKTALSNTTYPRGGLVPGGNGVKLPNHFLHRHSDGRLYIADVVGNTGTIHYIQTTKTTVEGDTDDGSKYNALDMGYGLYPTCIESYGNQIVIALFEGNELLTTGDEHSGNAKIIFWDTISESFNTIIWDEFPDEIITAMCNTNGVLYFASRAFNKSGFRLSRYIGGNTFETVFINKTTQAPYPGGMISIGDQLLFGSFIFSVASSGEGCVFSYKLSNSALGNGTFPLYSIRGDTQEDGTSRGTSRFVTAIAKDVQGERPVIAWGNLFSFGEGAVEIISSASSKISSASASLRYDKNNQLFESGNFNIGQPFKITKIRIPLAQAVISGISVTPTLYFDNSATSKVLTTIDYTNYPGDTSIVIRPENAVGKNNFFLRFDWTGEELCTIDLPITIEGELLND